MQEFSRFPKNAESRLPARSDLPDFFGVARQIVRRFENERKSRKLRMMRDAADRFEPDLAFSDAGMAVFARI